MKKVSIHRPGGLERLVIEEAPEPVPNADQVCVRVSQSGVNFADLVVRMGLYPSAREYVGWPITPGFEFAGTIESVGTDVGGFHTGDRVVGVTRFGGYSERICVAPAQLVALPDSITLADAAGFPVAFLTAWYALHELCRLRPGHRVLVHSAAGGVGGALVQLAKRAGAYVVAVVGAPEKVAVAEAAGADMVIDKSRTELWPAAERAVPDGFHVVLDANGAETLRESYRHLRSTGRLVIYGFHTMLKRGSDRLDLFRAAIGWLRTPRFDPMAMVNHNKAVLCFNLSYLFDELPLFQEAMTELMSALARGELRAPAVTHVPFLDVREAHRLLHSGKTVGKVVLDM
jgi:NADPH:quinone reductase-like Zn-dependent oxidoreductase